MWSVHHRALALFVNEESLRPEEEEITHATIETLTVATITACSPSLRLSQS